MEGKKISTSVEKAINTINLFKYSIKAKKDSTEYDYEKYRNKLKQKVSEVSARFNIKESLLLKIIEFNN